MPDTPDQPYWLYSAENSLEEFLKKLAMTPLPRPQLTPEQQQHIQSLWQLLASKSGDYNLFNLNLPSLGLPRPNPEDVYYYPNNSPFQGELQTRPLSSYQADYR